MKKGKLILQDGTSFEGQIFGSEKSTSGEVVFSTGMVGYPESLTDPSFRGQLLTFTFPLVGNYGVPDEKLNKQRFSSVFENEKIHARGIIVSEYSEKYNHWNAGKSLSKWLKEHGVIGITGIDTRALTQVLREKGCMLGKIVVEEKDTQAYNPNSYNILPEVSPRKPKVYKATQAKGLRANQQAGFAKQNTTPKRIIMLDCGVKNSTIKNFLDRNITVIRVPWNYDFFSAKAKKELNALGIANGKFNGLFISNGPGDPAKCTETINLIKKCFEKKIPTFGICLGNQLMGIAAGGKTYKLKYGHRAQNQPCINTETGRCYMTSQNHGFALNAKTLPKDWFVWFKHANDNTVEGIKHKKLPFFAVQFHPEAAPGPTDTEFLFDEFVKLL